MRPAVQRDGFGPERGTDVGAKPKAFEPRSRACLDEHAHASTRIVQMPAFDERLPLVKLTQIPAAASHKRHQAPKSPAR